MEGKFVLLTYMQPERAFMINPIDHLTKLGRMTRETE